MNHDDERDFAEEAANAAHVRDEEVVDQSEALWTDPVCGCTRSPDAYGTPCPTHAEPALRQVPVASLKEADVLVNLGTVNARPRLDGVLVTTEIVESYWSTFTGRNTELRYARTWHITDLVWIEG